MDLRRKRKKEDERRNKCHKRDGSRDSGWGELGGELGASW